MFTGIIEEVGTIQSLRRGSNMCTITVKANIVLQGTKIGDSISTDGVCLTVTDLTSTAFSADIMPETLDRSSLDKATPGTPVNLERAMPADGRFGGHIVSGHIDGTGTIRSIKEDGNAYWYTIIAPRYITDLVVEKGSIAIDGISLTVAKAEEDTFAVSVIPHTRSHTSLSAKRQGSIVNLENDIVGKYVERLMQDGGVNHMKSHDEPTGQDQKGRHKNVSPYGKFHDSDHCDNPYGITRDFLERHGF